MVIWEDPSVTDNSGRVVDVLCDAASGSDFAIGRTVVTCTAVDSSGNNGTCNFAIYVKGEDISLTDLLLHAPAQTHLLEEANALRWERIPIFRSLNVDFNHKAFYSSRLTGLQLKYSI